MLYCIQSGIVNFFVPMLCSFWEGSRLVRIPLHSSHPILSPSLTPSLLRSPFFAQFQNAILITLTAKWQWVTSQLLPPSVPPSQPLSIPVTDMGSRRILCASQTDNPRKEGGKKDVKTENRLLAKRLVYARNSHYYCNKSRAFRLLLDC